MIFSSAFAGKGIEVSEVASNATNSPTEDKHRFVNGKTVVICMVFFLVLNCAGDGF